MKPFPKIILLFTAVDWPIYMRRPMVYALAESAGKLGSVVVAVNRPLCPFSTIIKKPERTPELLGKPRLNRLANNFYLYSPRYFIHDGIANYFSPLEKLNLFALRHSYTHLQQKLGINEPAPMIWFNYPQQGYVMKLFDNSFCVFELYDNLSDFLGVESETANRLERKMRHRADLLLITSQKLHDKYASFYQRSYIFGNGLSRQIFDRLINESQDSIREILEIPSPRIGYAGMISGRLDWKLIGNLAALEPEWNFVFVGRMADAEIKTALKGITNIHFLREYDHSRVPSILKSFDIGILPYLDNPFFRYLNPLKFYEMAAAGLPMAASNIEELKKFPAELVQVVPNRPDAWRDALNILLESDRSAARRIGPKIAQDYVWEDMTTALLEKIRNDWMQ